MPLFGRPKKAKDNGADIKQSLEQLRASAETLELREGHLEKKADAETERARACVAKGDRRAALQCLQRKKVYMAQIDKMSQTRFSLEQQAMALEHSSMSVMAMDAMKQGSESMRATQKNMGLDDVDAALDDIQETMDIANEISDAISRPIDGGMAYIDDDELLAELEGFEELDTDERLLGINTSTETNSQRVVEPHAVVVEPQPQSDPEPEPEPSLNTVEDAEEAEFAALADSMNL